MSFTQDERDHMEEIVEGLGLSKSERRLLCDHPHPEGAFDAYCVLEGLGKIIAAAAPDDIAYMLGVGMAQVNPPYVRELVDWVVNYNAETLLSSVDFRSQMDIDVPLDDDKRN